MKTLILSLLLLSSCAVSKKESTFELKSRQSMLLTGKGPGQDGAINPYFGQECFAKVVNKGKAPFSVRIQQNGKILQEISVGIKEQKQIKLKPKDELYVDTEDKATAQVTFHKST